MAHHQKAEEGARTAFRGTAGRSASRSRVRRRTQLGLEQLEPRRVLAPIISEFLASNTDTVNGLRDFQGTLQDWIEIYNPDTQPVDLTGWKLKDSGSTWTFPAVTLGPGEFRIVFASGNEPDYAGAAHQLQAQPRSWRVPWPARQSGTCGARVPSQLTPSQENDISYGIGQNIEETKLVAAGADTRYFVPTNASLGTTWMQPEFQ